MSAAGSKRVLALGAGAAVLLLAAWALRGRLADVDWALLLALPPGTALACLALGAVELLLLVALAWYLLRGHGWRVPLVDLWLLVTAGLSANLITPLKAGLPLRVYGYQRLFGVPMAAGAGLTLVELVITTGVPAACGLGAAALALPGFRGTGAWLLLLLAATAATLALGLPLQALATRRAGRPGARPLQFLADTRAALATLRAGALGCATAAELAALAAQAVRLWLALAVLGLAPPEQGLIGFVALLAAITLSTVAGALSMVPLGLGVRDVSLALLLGQAGLSADAVVFAVLFQRVFSTLLPLGVGLASARWLAPRLLAPAGGPGALRPPPGARA